MKRRTAQTVDRRRLHICIPIILVAGWMVGLGGNHRTEVAAMPVGPVGSWHQGVISGRVVLGIAPVSGAVVRLLNEPGIGCSTSGDGTFRLSGVTEGPHTVALNVPQGISNDWTGRWIPVNITRKLAKQSVKFSLEQGGVIKGAVVDPAGLPVMKARIAVYHRDLDGGVWKQFTDLDPNGKFSLRVPSGEWLVEELPAFGSSHPSNSVLSWEQVRVEDGQLVTIRLRRIHRKDSGMGA